MYDCNKGLVISGQLLSPLLPPLFQELHRGVDLERKTPKWCKNIAHNTKQTNGGTSVKGVRAQAMHKNTTTLKLSVAKQFGNQQIFRDMW